MCGWLPLCFWNLPPRVQRMHSRIWNLSRCGRRLVHQCRPVPVQLVRNVLRPCRLALLQPQKPARRLCRQLRVQLRNLFWWHLHLPGCVFCGSRRIALHFSNSVPRKRMRRLHHSNRNMSYSKRRRSCMHSRLPMRKRLRDDSRGLLVQCKRTRRSRLRRQPSVCKRTLRRHSRNKRGWYCFHCCWRLRTHGCPLRDLRQQRRLQTWAQVHHLSRATCRNVHPEQWRGWRNELRFRGCVQLWKVLRLVWRK